MLKYPLPRCGALSPLRFGLDPRWRSEQPAEYRLSSSALHKLSPTNPPRAPPAPTPMRVATSGPAARNGPNKSSSKHRSAQSGGFRSPAGKETYTLLKTSDEDRKRLTKREGKIRPSQSTASHGAGLPENPSIHLCLRRFWQRGEKPAFRAERIGYFSVPPPSQIRPPPPNQFL
jgi:hypothetical protein